jgi:glyoxylase-like metal-dependent hydrolase (beta-lactamase superfamily II)
MPEFDPHSLPVTGAVHQVAAAVWRIVAPNPSPLTGPGTNTYVVGRHRPIVIDPGCDDPAHLERVLGVAGGQVERIVCTHSHPDHSPGAAWLRERTGAPVLGLPAPDDGYQDPLYAPDEGIADGDPIVAGDDVLHALHTPGHASNHLCLLLEREGLLFTGDHLMSGSTVIVIPPDGSMRLYLESLQRLRELPLAALAPGHGARMPNAIGEIERVIDHRLAREAQLARALAARRVASLDDVLPEVYDDVPKFMHVYARHSLLAHAVKLVEDGRVQVDVEVYRWLGD